MSTTWKRTILIGATSLALAPFAVAADGYRKAPAYDKGHGHGSTDSADAVYRVKAVVADLAEAADRAHRAAEHAIRYTGAYRSREIVRRLYDLEECAVSFEDEVRRYAYEPYRLRTDYRLLVATYRKAAYALEHGRTSPRVERAFERVSDLIYDLRYAWDDAYGNGWRGTGYDRDEYRATIRLRLPTWSWNRR